MLHGRVTRSPSRIHLCDRRSVVGSVYTIRHDRAHREQIRLKLLLHDKDWASRVVQDFLRSTTDHPIVQSRMAAGSDND